MIITEFLHIKTTNKNITHYKDLGYDITSGDYIDVPPIHLPYACKLYITVKCDVCNKEKEITCFSYNRNIEKYGYYACSTKCSKEKKNQTSLDKYGVKYATQTDEVKKQTKETKLLKYGDSNYINIEKQQITNLEKFGEKTYMNTDSFKLKSQETMISKYGVKYALQNNDIKDKWKNTNKNKFGSDYFMTTPLFKEKSEYTKFNKYGNINYNNRDKYIDTCVEIFGVENPMLDDDIKKKIYDNNMNKYGVGHHMHVSEIVEKIFMSGLKINQYNDTELYYQGTFEKDFLDRYYDKVLITRGNPIKYTYNNTVHIYYPDFYIPEINLIIEIKSTYWYNKHLDKNIAKMNECINQDYKFIFIIDKNYEIIDKMLMYKIYQTYDVCYQYKMKLDNKDEHITVPNISLFNYEYIDKSNVTMCKRIVEFIKKYEWLGSMPNRPTHRFVAMYGDDIGAVVIMSIPNSFSKILGDDTKDIERLISRGASASWTPKNTGSSLIMWSIRWMAKNTQYRLFSAYSDPEAKELGTIYQSCNFSYIGQKFGSDYLYYDINKPNIGWSTGRNYRKVSYYKKLCKELSFIWCDNWSSKYTMLWDNIPIEISTKIKSVSSYRLKNLIKRKPLKKHKYIYIQGKNNSETKYLKRIFKEKNKTYPYPKNRGM